MDAVQDFEFPRFTLCLACEFCDKPIYLFPKGAAVESCPSCHESGERLTKHLEIHSKLNDFLTSFYVAGDGISLLVAPAKLSEIQPEAFRAAQAAQRRENLRKLGNAGANAVLQSNIMDRNVPEPLRTAARRKVVFGSSR